MHYWVILLYRKNGYLMDSIFLSTKSKDTSLQTFINYTKLKEHMSVLFWWRLNHEGPQHLNKYNFALK